MAETDPTSTTPRPTATRPLLGLTVLVVEDSLYACDALRLLCLRSGARIRRADCLKSARRHLQVYRPAVVMVDLGLPDGNGAELISDLSQASPRVSALIGMSGDSFAEEAAMTAGADAFMAKPVRNLAAFQAQILSVLPKDYHPLGPRAVSEQEVTPDPMAYQDDLNHIASLLREGGNPQLYAYISQFLSGVARSAGDDALQMAADDLADHGSDKAKARILSLIDDRLSQPIAI